MAVFTPIAPAQLAPWLLPARILALEPISEGIENSSFFVTLDQAGQQLHQVLTVFERLQAGEMPWFLDALAALARQGLPVPEPLPLRDGTRLMTLAGKPAVLVPRLSGHHPLQPDAAQQHAIGQALARIHLTPLPARPPASPTPGEQLQQHWLAAGHHLPTDLREAVAPMVQAFLHPAGPVLAHGDLFRDNTLFEGAALTGLLDFYNAGPADPVYDLAIVLNDWCTADGRPQAAAEARVLSGYESIRPLSAAERSRLPQACAVAALRFWLSRLDTPAPGTDVTGTGHKDPAEFEQRFRQRWSALQTG